VKLKDEVKVKVWNRNVARLKYKVLVNVTKYHNEVQVLCYDPAMGIQYVEAHTDTSLAVAICLNFQGK